MSGYPGSKFSCALLPGNWCHIWGFPGLGFFLTPVTPIQPTQQLWGSLGVAKTPDLWTQLLSEQALFLFIRDVVQNKPWVFSGSPQCPHPHSGAHSGIDFLGKPSGG